MVLSSENSENFLYQSQNSGYFSPDHYDEEEGSSFVRILDENISKYTIRDFRRSRQSSFITDNVNDIVFGNSNLNVQTFSDKSENLNISIDQTPMQSCAASMLRQF